MNVKTGYTFSMREFDEDTGNTLCHVVRHAEGEGLDELAQAFRYFLWNAGFTYVADVIVTKENGGEVSTQS